MNRDIKIAYVILGRHGETLVVDWGLAKVIGKAGSDERTLIPSSTSGTAETMLGSALGTPAYMSPEQAYESLDEHGPGSDVSSLGVTLYCLLTGRPEFEGDDLGAILRRVQKGEFPTPRTLDATIDRELEAVFLKARATLRRAISSGGVDLAGLRNDPELASLRDRDGFRLLLLDRATPPDPFMKRPDSNRAKTTARLVIHRGCWLACYSDADLLF